MSGKYEELSKQILEKIGGKENVVTAAHCATRLRFNTKDKSKVDIDGLKATQGVTGALFSGEQLQIIIGFHVQDVYEEVCKQGAFEMKAQVEDTKAEKGDQKKEKITPKKVISKIFDTITGCVMPILPLLTAAGLFKLIPTLLGPSLLNVVSDQNMIMQIFSSVGSAGFYFFPVVIGYSASKKLKTNTALAMFLCALLLYPTYTGWVAAGETVKVLGLSIPLVDYSSQFLPSILIVAVMKYVEKGVNKIIPTQANLMLAPFVTMLIMLPLEFFILAPAGYYAGVGIINGLNGLYGIMGPFAIAFVGATWYLLVATGMHQAMIPLMIQNVLTNGYDAMLSVGSSIAAYALMGVAVAYIVKAKKEEKSLAITNGLTLILGGMSELTVFSCMLRFRNALIATMAGGFVGGLIAGFMKIKFTLMGPTAFYTVMSFTGKDLGKAIICSVIAFVVSFVMCIVLGFQEKEQKSKK